MRILLALITIFTVFQAQAFCYITGKIQQPVFRAESITLDLDTGNSSDVKNINFTGSAPAFHCYEGTVTPNEFSLAIPNSSSYYYLIENGSHNLFLKISIKPQSPVNYTVNIKNSDGAATLLNKLQYKLEYNVETNYQGAPQGTIKMGDSFLLGNINIKPKECNVIGCLVDHDNRNEQYIYQVWIIPKFTPTTCTFKNQEIAAPSISYQDLVNNAFTAPTTKPPELQCSSTIGVATSNIHYHFEPISTLSGNILQNELGTGSESAGEVGFELKNNGQTITFQPTQKFTLASRGTALLNGRIYPLDLQLRYARYGNKVFTGKVQSKVKVVVDYD